MIYIYKDRQIVLKWTLYKSASTIAEDFSNAIVKMFVIGATDKIPVEIVSSENGTLTAEFPMDLADGSYSVEVIYAKNRIIDSNNSNGHDLNAYRSIMRSRKDKLFAITSDLDMVTPVGEGPVNLSIKSSVASYGYDGLSAYEIAVMRGTFHNSESEWLSLINDRMIEYFSKMINCIYLKWKVNKFETRNTMYPDLRRKGVIISYVDNEGNTYTEKCINDTNLEDKYWGIDSNWMRIDELSLDGDIFISSKGTWVLNGVDTGYKAVGPKGDNGLYPTLKTINNQLQFSYDGEHYNLCSSDYIAAWFKWSEDNKVQISRDNSTWSDLSPEFSTNIFIKGYVGNASNLEQLSEPDGTVYGVGPTYDTSDAEHINPIYRVYVKTSKGWVDNGIFKGISVGLTQELGDNDSIVMSQAAVTKTILNKNVVFSEQNIGTLNFTTEAVNPMEVRNGYYDLNANFVENTGFNTYVYAIGKGNYRLGNLQYGAAISNMVLLDEAGNLIGFEKHYNGACKAVMFGEKVAKIAIVSKSVIHKVKIHNEIDRITESINMLDADKVTEGFIIAESINEESSYSTTFFIPVDAAEKYTTGSWVVRIVSEYDRNKKFIRQTDFAKGELTLQPETAYIRLCFLTSQLNQIILSNVAKNPEGVYRPKYAPMINRKLLPPMNDYADKSIRREDVTFFKSKNLYNKNDRNFKAGKYLSGYILGNGPFETSGYIRVNEGEHLLFSNNGKPESVRFLQCLDEDYNIKKQVSSADVSSLKSYVVEAGISYIRVTIERPYEEYNNLFQIEVGDEVTAYKPYQTALEENAVSFDSLDFTGVEGVSKNLLDPAAVMHHGEEFFINTNNGEVNEGFGYGYTDYIPIDKDGLVIQGGYVAGVYIGHAVYSAEKKFIRGVREHYVEYEEGDAYVRFSVERGNEIMVEKGSIASPYEAFKGLRRIIPAQYLPTPSGGSSNPQTDLTKNINLPDKIYAVVGDTLQLFFSGILCLKDIQQYDILISCSKGQKYNRYFEYKPTEEDVGTTTFKLILKDSDRNLLGSKTCTLVTKRAVKSPTAMKKVLCFGDSLTSSGEWAHEAERRLISSDGNPTGLGLTNISFEGLKNYYGTGYFGVGGWQWSSYTTEGPRGYRFQVSGVGSLSVGARYANNGNTFIIQEVNVTNGSGNILCDYVKGIDPAAAGTLTKESGSGDATIHYTSWARDSTNPLWNGSKMTFVDYANEYTGGQIDVVYTLLSWNGITPGKTDFSDIITEVEKFADTLHAEFPNAKLKIMGLQVPSITGGMGMSYGATGTSYADQYGMVVTAFNMNRAYQEFANRSEYSSYVEYVDIASQFDSEYNMPYEMKNVNTRNNAQQEMIGTNGVHPSTAGYMQIGDVVFRNFIANFCQ